MPVVAVRAGEILEEDKLKAHLALLLRVEHLGALFGSGTSVSAGGQHMSQVWTAFKTGFAESHKFLLDKGLLAGAGEALANFEQLVNKIQLASEFYQSVEPNDTALAGYQKALRDIQVCLLKAVLLAPRFWDSDFSDVAGQPSLSDYQKFLIRFCANRQPGQPNPWIFTLNYDLGVEWAAESLGISVNNGFKGIHYRRFDPSVFDIGMRNVLASGQAQYSVHGINYVKLHGSLSWHIDQKSNLREASAEVCRAAFDKFLDAEASPPAPFPSQIILPSTAKFSETVGFVYGEMIRRFHEFVSKDQVVLLISGYSCGDDHINRILVSALENPTLQLVVFYPPFDGYKLSLSQAPLLELAFQNQLPNVTIIGGNASAYFNEVANLLPIPAIYDQRRDELKSMLRALSSSDQAAPPTASVAKPSADAVVEKGIEPEDPEEDKDSLAYIMSGRSTEAEKI
jgi:hypothetical protein